MRINIYSKRILKLIGISLMIPFTLFEINTINKQIKAETNLIAATDEDVFLYQRMGATYLCFASTAEIDFQKGLTIASLTFANVITQKHGGAFKKFGNEKFDQNKLYNIGTFQIVGSALDICPGIIPNNIKIDYEKKIKELVKETKK